MKIKSVSLENLFFKKEFCYTIPLDKKDGVTIIHGPNGCGKTTFLKILEHFSKAEFLELSDIPFKKLTISFADGGYIQLKPKRIKMTPKGFASEDEDLTSLFESLYDSFTVNVKEKKQKLKKFVIQPEHYRVKSYEMTRYTTKLKRIGPNLFEHSLTGRILDSSELRGIYRYKWEEVSDSLEVDIMTVLKNINFELIETHRLYKTIDRDDDKYSDRKRNNMVKHTLRVEDISSEIKDIIEQEIYRYNRHSQNLDSSFSRRLVQFTGKNRIPLDKLKEKYIMIDSKREDLEKYGILYDLKPIRLPRNKKLEPLMKKVLWLHLDDMDQKLSSLSDLKDRIELLIKIIGKRFKYKNVNISKKNGLEFTYIDDSGEVNHVLPEQLSSGEQHQIVLFFDLLFKTKKSNIVLVDEPELSLHVDWQREFLQDLIQVSKINENYFVVATHSPQIISGQWSSAVGLGGGIKNADEK